MTTETIRIGFIGFGNMAGAVAEGLLADGCVRAEQMSACSGHMDKLEKRCSAMGGVRAMKDSASVCDASDMVFLAVKPVMLPEVLPAIKDKLRGKIVVSVAAGYDLERYRREGLITEDTHIICTCPNTPVSIQKGIFIIESNHTLTEEEYELTTALLEKISLVIPVKTSLLGIGGTIAGCSPAFVAMFMEALSDAAVMYGIPRATAYSMVARMMEGTAAMQQKTGAHPGQMKDAVASPGGTTIKGIAALEENGFRGAVIDAIKAIQG